MKTHKEQSRIQVIDWLLRMMKGMMIKEKKYNNKLDKIKQNYKRNKKLIT